MDPGDSVGRKNRNKQFDEAKGLLVLAALFGIWAIHANGAPDEGYGYALHRPGWGAWLLWIITCLLVYASCRSLLAAHLRPRHIRVDGPRTWRRPSPMMGKTPRGAGNDQCAGSRGGW